MSTATTELSAWRIYPHAAPWAQSPGFDPLDGAGGRISANRWNDPGLPVIYASDSASLAALETLANLSHPGQFAERTLLHIQVTGGTEQVSLQQVLRLREDAPAADPERLTREFGSRWLSQKRSLVLLVPSFVMPYDHNILINPLHPQAGTGLRLLSQERIHLDQRLLHGAGS